jgi:hypothetical protein
LRTGNGYKLERRRKNAVYEANSSLGYDVPNDCGFGSGRADGWACVIDLCEEDASAGE